MNTKKLLLALALALSIVFNLVLPAGAALALPASAAIQTSVSPDPLDPPKSDWPPPVVRSTLYNGDLFGQVVYSHEARFDLGPSMTVEAWVKRDDGYTCMTILSNELPGSFWFGACPQLRFSRDTTAENISADSVPINLWTHVAVSYDGAHASFYLDGHLSGWEALSHAEVFTPGKLRLGFDPIYGTAFSGSLDEVRLWSVARTEQQIRDGMFEEIRSGTGLVAVFANGSYPETLMNSTPELVGVGVDNTSYINGLGILPTGLVVPKAVAVPVMDGHINETSEFAGAERAIIRYRYPAYNVDAVAFFVHTDSDLHVGYYSYTSPLPYPYFTSNLSLFLDNNYSRDALIQTNDIRVLSYFELSTQPVLLYGDGEGNWVICPTLFCINTGWQVATALCHENLLDRCREYRIAKTRLGDWNQTDGVAFGHMQFESLTDNRMFPSDAISNAPVTWTSMLYSEPTNVFLPMIQR